MELRVASSIVVTVLKPVRQRRLAELEKPMDEKCWNECASALKTEKAFMRNDSG